MPSRARAHDAIKRGMVRVDGTIAHKTALKVSETTQIEINDPALAYVSRAALKLKAALDIFPFSPKSLKILDIGASTGGFSQVLLEEGADHIYALDVGHDQLHTSLLNHKRLTNIEGVNARDLTPDLLATSIQAVVSDVSFISIKLALPKALDLVENRGWAIMLFKPQFEVGKKFIGKGGIVRDERSIKAAISDCQNWISSLSGWQLEGLVKSPIKGSNGNQEYLLGARKAL